MKITVLLSTLLLAGAAQAGTCASADHTTAATLENGQITVVRLNGIMPGGSVVKTLTLQSPIEIHGARGVQTVKANLDDGGRTAIRFETPEGVQDLTQAKLKSIRLSYGNGVLEIYATDCR